MSSYFEKLISAYLEQMESTKAVKDSAIEEAIKIVQFQSQKLEDIRSYSNDSEYMQWYNTTINLFKTCLVSEFYSSIKNPNLSSYRLTKVYYVDDMKPVMRNILDTITEFPDKCLLKKKEQKKLGSNSNSEYKIYISSDVYENTRGYLIKLFNQINLTYSADCFDACALCMRKSIEICLILLYEENEEQDLIKTRGDYFPLKKIINYTESNNKYNISSNSSKTMKRIVEFGNNSAHSIYYSCGRKDLEGIKVEYKALIQELLYKSKIKK